MSSFQLLHLTSSAPSPLSKKDKQTPFPVPVPVCLSAGPLQTPPVSTRVSVHATHTEEFSGSPKCIHSFRSLNKYLASTYYISGIWHHSRRPRYKRGRDRGIDAIYSFLRRKKPKQSRKLSTNGGDRCEGSSIRRNRGPPVVREGLSGTWRSGVCGWRWGWSALWKLSKTGNS